MSNDSSRAQLYEVFAAILVIIHAIGPAVCIAAPPTAAFGAAIVFLIWAVRAQIAKE